ncbi:hypothetical protein SVIOM342S_09287 [Streptomyces violaceorubidus]
MRSPLLGEDLCRSADQVRDDCVEAPVVLPVVRPSIRLQDWSAASWVRLQVQTGGAAVASSARFSPSQSKRAASLSSQSAIIYTLLGYQTAKDERYFQWAPSGVRQVREPVLGAPDIAPHLADSRECLFEPTHDTPSPPECSWVARRPCVPVFPLVSRSWVPMLFVSCPPSASVIGAAARTTLPTVDSGTDPPRQAGRRPPTSHVLRRRTGICAILRPESPSSTDGHRVCRRSCGCRSPSADPAGLGGTPSSTRCPSGLAEPGRNG